MVAQTQPQHFIVQLIHGDTNQIEIVDWIKCDGIRFRCYTLDEIKEICQRYARIYLKKSGDKITINNYADMRTITGFQKT